MSSLAWPLTMQMVKLLWIRGLKSTSLFDKMIEMIPDEEYEELIGYIEEEIEKSMRYNTSAAAVVKSVINDLPTQAQAAMNIVNNFDKEKFQEVVQFAQAANGNRPIE